MSAESFRVCLVEDDPIMGESLQQRFALEAFDCDWCRTGEEALRRISTHRYHAVISDIRLPDLSGEVLFEKLSEREVHLPPWIFITGYGSIDRAIALLKQGAADYITKPFDLDLLIERMRVYAPLGERGERSLPSLGRSEAIRSIEEKLPMLAAQPAAVLIQGESGVGKEVIAHAIHDLDTRADRGSFVAVNCGGLTESLLTAELFGYEKGAFTGAIKAHRGLFEQANGGTLFLDEIGDMPLAMQVRLLRVLQDGRITRIGGEGGITVRFRLICATHRDLRKMVDTGQFREDLFYRINVIHMRVPPLRERAEDVLWYARRFLRELSNGGGGGTKVLSAAAETALLNHLWPGNVRELRHCVERAFVLSRGRVLEPHSLFDDGSEHVANASRYTLEEYLEQCERGYLLRELARNEWHMGHTAKAIGISRKGLWERLRRLQVDTKSLRDTD